MLTLFLAEGRELLNRVDAALMTLERSPDARASIDEVFRALHSLKGMSATVGLHEPAAALHAGETVLSAARDAGEVTRPQVRALLALGDAMRGCLDAAEQGSAAPGTIVAITARLDALVSREPVARASLQRVSAATAVRRATAVDGASWKVEVTIAEDAAIPSARATVVVRRLARLAPVLRVEPDETQQGDESWDRVLAVWLGGGADTGAIEAAVRGAGDIAECHVAREVTVAERAAPESVRTVRIPAQRLDDLLDLVGELVLARDRLMRTVLPVADDAARTAMDDASRLIMQLRDAILTSRMVPLAQVFDRYPRHVRETAGGLGKEIDLVLEGRELEV
ncbi:MAG TPA: Hpt domain-containing protein, partial [Gemmatimonadaceae bacterium]|nr:Hpt domain-containing protein [Gemmatimonadaceae bacterium]